MKKTIVRMLNKLIEIFIYKQKQIEVAHLRNRQGVNIHPLFYVGAGTFINCDKNIRQLQIAEETSMRRHCSIRMYPDATLIIGKKVFFNNYCSINVLGRVEIGDNTIFGEGVKIYDHNHLWERKSDGTLVTERDGFDIGTVKIGADCWIGSNVTILNNVEIGNNVIIGANCLIYKSVPANSIVRSDATVSVIAANPNA